MISFAARLTTSAALAATLLAGSGMAHARRSISDIEYRSPKSWALELRGGPYTPEIDQEFSGLPAEDRPHQKFFGGDQRLMFQVELDYQLFQNYGSLAIATSAGFFRERASAFIEPAAGGAATERSGDRTSLSIYPITLGVVYRFDMGSRYHNIPLVPYAKLGLDYFIWSVTEGDGGISDPGGDGKGLGGTLGWHAAAGLAVLLDFVDPGAAQELDSEIGVNHTFAFIELIRHDVSGLGQGSALHLGDTTWQVGLMFEF